MRDFFYLQMYMDKSDRERRSSKLSARITKWNSRLLENSPPLTVYRYSRSKIEFVGDMAEKLRRRTRRYGLRILFIILLSSLRLLVRVFWKILLYYL